MYLNRVLVHNFKNIRETELFFSPKFNCISGNNGEGKTNLLDAIFYLSTTKSYFSSSDTYTFTFGENNCSLHGAYVDDQEQELKISMGIKSGGEKIVKKNGKQYKKLAEHIGLLPIVMVSPADANLINDSGEMRRRFMNLILSQVDSEYLRRIQSYNQLLLQRNKLLKTPSFSIELLETIGMQMETHAQYIYKKRDELCQSLMVNVSDFYRSLSGGKEEITLKYTSDLQKGDLSTLFEKNLDRDRMLKYTSAGIHRDDIEFYMNSFPIKKCGSQGQQKSFLIALKLAKFLIMKQLHNVTPILLLDDVFDKLDMGRVEYLIELVSSDQFGQIFISDSNKVRISSILERVSQQSKSFTVTGGIYSETEL